MKNFLATILLIYFCYSEFMQAAELIQLNYALFTSSEGFDSSGAVPAIELAEEMINRNSSILPGYTLVHDEVRDTLCNRARSLDLFFEAISLPSPPLLGLIGCGCSVASTPVAEIIHHKSMSQVSYGSSSVELDNHKRFPNFFRTHPSDSEVTQVFMSVVKQYGWKRVAFLTQDEGLFTGIHELLVEPLAEMDVVVENRVFPSEFPIRGLTSTNFFFEDEDYRVFFVNTYANVAQHIICEAHNRGYTYSKQYAWILIGWYVDNWWTQEENPSTINCTDTQLKIFLHRALSILWFAVAADEDAVTDTGLTEKQFNKLYENKFNQSNYTFSFVGTLAYDALWSLAFALDTTNQMLHNDSVTRREILSTTGCPGVNEMSNVSWELVPLENFTNDNELMGCVIRWNLQRTDFIGVSGRVHFNENGSRFQALSQVFQYRESDGTIQRAYIALTNKTVVVFVNNESINTVFPEEEGGIPLDGTPIPQINSFHLALVGIYYSLAVLGIVFSTVCLVFNFTQRKKKIVRLTSPNLNYFLIAGTYLMFLSVFCRLIPSDSHLANNARCILDVLVDTIGYCLAFGVVLAKMRRIHHIFKNPTAKKAIVKDWQLILVILAVTGFGTLLVTLQVAIPQFRPDPELIPDPEAGTKINENGIKIDHYFYTCFPEDSQATTWISVTFLYLGLLQVIGIILAIQTRKVKVKVLNDSKYIAALVYISSIVLITRAVAVFALRHLLNVSEVFFSGGILINGSAFLSLVFIPKMVSLVKDPNGESIFSEGNDLTVSMNGRKGSTIGDRLQGLKVKQLEERIVQLEAELEQKNEAFLPTHQNHNCAEVTSTAESI